LNTNVQLGATYGVSKSSTNAYSNAYKVAAGFINAATEEVYLHCDLTIYIPEEQR
jgi:hypothetical protein